MVRNRWIGLILLIATILTGCYSKTIPMEPPKPICLVPTNLPNNRIGRLGIQFIQVGQSLRVIIPSDSLFYPASSHFKSSAYPGLYALATRLGNYRHAPLTIRAYTDDLGTAELADHQARRLQTFLWAQGFCHRCLTIVGVGPDHAVSSNRTPMGSYENRRIEISYSPLTRD